ncbi:MAG: Asp-tRNA(Asn)/Glu-tRNA(Gln) amidotransferase GatCAB subunit B, partial [Candidatus Nanopelagicales bacterium]
DTGKTTPGRTKEEAEDYRYFPEPDLAPVAASEQWVEQLRATLPEPPAQRRARLQQHWGFTDLEMRDVVNAQALELIEQTIEAGASAAGAKKWWLGELARRSNDSGVALPDLPIDAVGVARIEALVAEGTLNDKMARQVIDGILAGEGSADEVVAARGLALVSDDTALLVAVDEAIAGNPDVAQKVRDGKVAAVGALVGAVMKSTRGQADAGRVRELLVARLTGE